MTETKDLSILKINDKQREFTEAQIQVLQTSLRVTHATPGDFRALFHQSRRTGLDPFLRQLYMIARQEWNPETRQKEWRQTFQTGIEGYRVVAGRTAQSLGAELKHLPVRYWDADGKEYDAWFKTEPPAMIRYTIQIGDQSPVIWDARYDEYVPMKDEYGPDTIEDGKKVKGKATGRKMPQGMWAKRPTAQLEKCAEAGALRRACPQDLGGIYIHEEMDNGRVVDVDAAEVHDVVSTGRDWLAELNAATTSQEVLAIWDACKKAEERTYEFDDLAGKRGAELKAAEAADDDEPVSQDEEDADIAAHESEADERAAADDPSIEVEEPPADWSPDA